MGRMRIERRSWSARIALACSGLAAIGYSIALARETGIAVTIACLGLALLVAGFAIRPKAQKVPGAFYSGSADMLGDRDKKLPGQLSISSTGVTWIPSRYSVSRGAGEWSASTAEGLQLSLQRGPALLDLILTAQMSNTHKRRFLTHRSRRLRNAIERLWPNEQVP